jgi:phage terminase large subunit
LVELCYDNENAGAVITIARKTFPALRASVMRDFFEILEREDAYNPEQHNKSEANYVLFGNLVEFISVDQPQKVRGRKRDILFINEANELALEDWRQLLLRTTGKVIIDYNPSDEYHWIMTEVIPRSDASFFKTTYKDNPYLDRATIQEIERLKEADPNYWRIYGLGERGVNQAAVFTWEVGEIAGKRIGTGLDFGFTNDPTAVIDVYQDGNTLILHERLYSTGLTNPDISEELDKLNVETIIADSAEPKSIEELFRLGHNVKPARKGPDSIRQGIDIMRRHKLLVTAESTQLQKELRAYRWEQDKNGRNLNRPVDKDNHGIDAVRYVCLNLLTTSRSGSYFLA